MFAHYKVCLSYTLVNKSVCPGLLFNYKQFCNYIMYVHIPSVVIKMSKFPLLCKYDYSKLYFFYYTLTHGTIMIYETVKYHCHSHNSCKSIHVFKQMCKYIGLLTSFLTSPVYCNFHNKCFGRMPICLPEWKM